ncbi:uncharacterized protein PSFLO_01978 [Pseudozyma flocculosa]|uniref:Uncharacterized protein n=1 Tax=Pseudozyma flocculosa TaxID=84751 RepID=A0A5C3EYN1_9BASI|nr:uncharacterized protein PSFLO_01978 [Pseudozyma flocculosa]
MRRAGGADMARRGDGGKSREEEESRQAGKEARTDLRGLKGQAAGRQAGRQGRRALFWKFDIEPPLARLSRASLLAHSLARSLVSSSRPRSGRIQQASKQGHLSASMPACVCIATTDRAT